MKLEWVGIGKHCYRGVNIETGMGAMETYHGTGFKRNDSRLF